MRKLFRIDGKEIEKKRNPQRITNKQLVISSGFNSNYSFSILFAIILIDWTNWKEYVVYFVSVSSKLTWNDSPFEMHLPQNRTCSSACESRSIRPSYSDQSENWYFDCFATIDSTTFDSQIDYFSNKFRSKSE